MFDDCCCSRCSEWVNDRAPVVSTVAGILATFRSPVTKHVPSLNGLLGGLWDLWRNRTYAGPMRERRPVIAGLARRRRRASSSSSAELVAELLNNVIQDHEPRLAGGPPIFTPELP